MASATPRNRRVIAGADPSDVESPVQAADPARGARRREVFLLAAYGVLFIIGVWTVVASELTPDSTDTARHGRVAEPTQKSQSAGK